MTVRGRFVVVMTVRGRFVVVVTVGRGRVLGSVVRWWRVAGWFGVALAVARSALSVVALRFRVGSGHHNGQSANEELRQMLIRINL